MAANRPDIIVAIDFGTTYTGVAWARPQKHQVLQSPIQIIRNWPGVSNKNEQKVPTCLIYNDDGSVSSWGFLCEDEEDEPLKRKHEFFKIFLDHQTLDDAHRQGIQQAPASVNEAQKLAVDFLREVYIHVKSTVEVHTGISHSGWQHLQVEFIFSVPTTWRSQSIINIFKSCISEAGFGREGQAHVASVELTESEAAAVGTIKGSPLGLQTGDVFLSVDAGGGTTDFALMEVKEAREPFPALSQINQVDGIGIGASLIDRAFISHINLRLGQFPDLVNQLPPNCAERLAKSDRFKTTKHKFGEKVYQSNSYKMILDGVPFNFNHLPAGIELGRIVLSWEEMQSLFDPHVDGILRKIQEQLEWMQARGIAHPINYMILSGGLGSSKYVRDRLQAELTMKPHACATRVKLVQAPDPQLVVIKGLLLDRLQSLESNIAPVIVSRVARASYGMICKSKYNPEIHAGEAVMRDQWDGEMYAMGQIDWIIRKGDHISTNTPISQTFTKKIPNKDANRVFDCVIMISDRDRDFLPHSSNQEGAKQLCIVQSDLTGVQHEDMIKKRKNNKKFIPFKGTKFYVCTFEIRAIVAPAEMRFELWFAGQRFSGNHEPIRITWDNEGAKVGE
ncbi:hypothetical protein F5Y16DRAFT_421650 [Xylariaceae sp. FL0255]|nr:hypothetical protein F5Y16DRAFT_421650 [Xylariaceae sp. FL0255]